MKRWLLLCFLFISCITVYAQKTSSRAGNFNVKAGEPAIQGYDPVSYFTQGKAVKGKKEWALQHEGILYYFSSSENKELFKKSPERYEPQYGGWCAFAMGDAGEKVEIDPETFKIKENRLYLFYNKYFTNTLKSWNKNETVLRSNADKNWKTIYK